MIRGSYHLYQGFGGFVGNMIMGVIFGLIYLRWKRVGPLVVAHTMLDVVAFVGYALRRAARVLALMPGRQDGVESERGASRRVHAPISFAR